MAKIVLTDAEMKMLHSLWSDAQASGELKIAAKDDEDTRVQEVADTDSIIICYAAITHRVIETGKKLKAILKWGVGVDSVDVEAANQQRLPVCHCPHYGSATTADHAFALLIALARKLVPLVNSAREALIQEAPPGNVKNGDALAALGEPVRWLPYGEQP
jgi:D-3-phosphoglycerate dehydrogenase